MNKSHDENTIKRKGSNGNIKSKSETSPENLDLDPGLKIFGKHFQRKKMKKFRIVVEAKADDSEAQISPQLDPSIKIINEFGISQLKEVISKKERKQIEKQFGKKITKNLKITKNPFY